MKKTKTKTNKKKNINCFYIPNHPYRILIIAMSDMKKRNTISKLIYNHNILTKFKYALKLYIRQKINC